MIVTTSNEITTNIESAKEFSISMNSSRLFAMLSNYLYQSKKQSVLSELSANAKDSHQLHGNQHQPIDIVVPTRIDQNLRIRDHGTGLSEEDVYRLLTTYGESGDHKRASNDFEGAWGIGSKSVAAVSNTWNYKSWHDGTCKEYLVYINDKSIPSLTKICENSCGDQTGFEVAIPVKMEDVNEWTSLFAIVFKYWKVRPNIFNHTVAWKNIEIVSESDTCRIYRNEVLSYYDKTKFIVGERGYPVDLDKVLINCTGSEREFAKSTHILFKFKIGDLELSLSRENLQYSEKTIVKITENIKKAYLEFKHEFTTHLNDATNSLEYRAKFLSTVEKYFAIAGRDLYKFNFLHDFIEGNKWKVAKNDLQSITFDVSPTAVFKVFNGTSIQTVTARSTCWKTYAVSRSLDKISIKTHYLNNDFKIIVCDIRSGLSRIRALSASRTNPILIVYDVGDIHKELAKWVSFASDLPKPTVTRATRVKNVVVNSPLWIITLNSFKRVHAPTDFTNCAYFKFQDARTSGSIVDRKYLIVCNDLGINVYGLKMKDKAPKGLPSCKEFIENTLYKININDVKKSFALTGFNSHSLITSMIALSKCNPKSNFSIQISEFAKEISGFKTDLYEKYHRLCQVLNVKEHDFSNVVKYEQKAESLFAKYPMLRYNNYYTQITKEDFVSYVNLIEGVK